MVRLIESGSSLVKRASINSDPIAANPSLMAAASEPGNPPIAAATRNGLPESSSRLRRAKLCIRTI